MSYYYLKYIKYKKKYINLLNKKKLELNKNNNDNSIVNYNFFNLSADPD